MPSITLHVDDQNHERKLSVDAASAEKVEEIRGEVDHATVTLERDTWRDVDNILERRTDHLVVDDGSGTWFAGRYDDDSKGDDATIDVRIAGYERDALDAEPLGDNVVYQNIDDSTIVGDLVGQVGTLQVGTVETIDSSLSMSFSYANPSKALRDTEEAGGGELRFNYDQTVDYVSRLGADKPGVILSPAERTIIGEPEVVKDGRENVTHIRGFGAQSGPDQVTAKAVASSYSGGKQVWREYENKDIKEKSRLEKILEQRISEIENEPTHIEVEATALGVDVDLGDRVTVTLPEEGIDRMLRVVSRREILEATGVSFVLSLTNRLLTGEDRGRKARKDLQRFNRGYEGFVSRDQTASGWDAAGDGTPQELVVVNWPDDIIEEQDVTLAVQGRAWRSPVDPQPHDHDLEISLDPHAHDVTVDTSDHEHPVNVLTTSEDNADFTDVVAGGSNIEYPTVNENWSTIHNFSPSTTDQISLMIVNMTVLHDDSGQSDAIPITVRLYDSTDGVYYPGTAGFNAAAVPFRLDGGPSNLTFLVSSDVSNHAFEVQAQTTGPYSIDLATQVQYAAAGAHNHTLDFSTQTDQDGGESIFETTDGGGGVVKTETTDTTAGAAASVITTFQGNQYYPSDVTIEVNGTQVGTVTGDANSDWTETIDLKGELDPGLNTITATPSTRGEVNLVLASELFRRGRTS